VDVVKLSSLRTRPIVISCLSWTSAAVSFVKYVSRKNSCLPAVTLRNVKSGGAKEEVVWVEEHRIFECRKRLKLKERERLCRKIRKAGSIETEKMSEQNQNGDS
jgi:hypothetical protein